MNQISQVNQINQMVEVGKRISDLLTEKNMTQRELANVIGVTEVTIGRYVNGTREPKGSILSDIAKALGVTTDYLLGIDIKTIAAHHEEDWTEEELNEIEKFKQYIRSKREK